MRYVARRDRIGSERIDDELVLINFDTSHYYCLNGTATVAWSLLSNGPAGVDDVAGILSALQGATSAQTRADVQGLVDALQAEGLVEAADGAVDATDREPTTVPPVAGRYVKPLFEKFGTLEQLMLAGE